MPPAAFAASRASAAPFEEAKLAPMTFRTGENPSETKLKANNALKTSSVKRVQYLMSPDALNEARTARYKAVQQPHQAYMGRKGTPDLIVQADKAPMKDSVRPVGATKVMGWPARHLRCFCVVLYAVDAVSLWRVTALRVAPLHAVEQSRRWRSTWRVSRAHARKGRRAIRVGHAAQPAAQ